MLRKIFSIFLSSVSLIVFHNSFASARIDPAQEVIAVAQVDGDFLVSEADLGALRVRVMSERHGHSHMLIVQSDNGQSYTHLLHTGNQPVTKTLGEEWTYRLVWFNGQTGAALYAVYLNGKLQGYLTVQPNGDIKFEQIK